MADLTVKIPPALKWTQEDLIGHPEAVFRVQSPWSVAAHFAEGVDYRLVEKSGTFSPIPTIDIIAPPASGAFWQLQAAALDGKVLLDHQRSFATSPDSSLSMWEQFQSMGSGVAGILVGVQLAIRTTAENVINPDPKWTISGDGPWQYAKEESYNVSHWIRQVGIDRVMGTLVTVQGEFKGEPCGHLTSNEATAISRIALPSSVTDSNYVYRATDPNQQIQYDRETGQYYLDSTNGGFITNVDVDVYRSQDVQLRNPLPAPHFTNFSPATVKATQLSPVTRSVFEQAWQQRLPKAQGGSGMSEAESLKWAAQELARSWQYEISGWNMFRVGVMPETSYQQFHQKGQFDTAHCEIAATEFFHAARAYGYNVRLATGRLQASDPVGHAWVEYSDASGVHVIDATPSEAAVWAGRAWWTGRAVQTVSEEKLPPPSLDFGFETREALKQQFRQKLLVAKSMNKDAQVIVLDRIRPILQAVHDPLIMGELKIVRIPRPAKTQEEIILYPEEVLNALPTHLQESHSNQVVVHSVYEALEGGDEIYWSSKLLQYVFKTDSPGMPRRLRIHHFRDDCLAGKGSSEIAEICSEHTIPAITTQNTLYKKEDVPAELRKIFEDLAPYAQHPFTPAALRPSEIVRKVYTRFLDTPEVSRQFGGADCNTLFEGLSPIPVENNYDISSFLGFYRAARSYGYPVVLGIQYTSIIAQGLIFTLSVRDGHGMENIANAYPYSSKSGLERLSAGGADQKMRWGDHPDPQITTFLTAMAGQVTQTDDEVFQNLPKVTAAISPLLGAISTGDPSWETQFTDNPQMTVRPLSTHYELPDNSHQLRPEGAPLTWQLTALHGHPSGNEVDIYNDEGRQISVRTISYLGETQVIDALKNTKGDPISLEALTSVTFQQAKCVSISISLYQLNPMYYSPTLDLAIYERSVNHFVLKNAQGQFVSLTWRFPNGANRNQLRPILRADLSSEVVKTPTVPGGEGYIPNGDNYFKPYSTLDPVLDRFLSEIRQGSGLRAPTTGQEQERLVMLYRQLLQNGILEPSYNTANATAHYEYLHEAQRSAVTVANKIYVVAEYQRLWKEYQGHFPEAWTTPTCVPTEKDNIQIKETICIPQSAPSPESIDHQDWMRQLAIQARKLKDIPNLPIDIQKLLSDAAQWVPERK